jgi:hypothetical protein
VNEEDILTFKLGDTTIGENLRAAVESGVVRRRPDGTFELQERGGNLFVRIRPEHLASLGCGFLNLFMFEQVYAKAAAPVGCEACYKIKVAPRTLRELVAGYETATRTPCMSKWGVELFNPHSQAIYAGYFYFTGLEAARAQFPVIRKMVDEHPKLGPEVPMIIKRGCTNYEVALGPSDKYSFRPELREVEAYFKSRFRPAEPSPKTLAEVLYGQWTPFAFRIGDDTYLDFTGGKPLYPKPVTYAP